MRRVGISPRAWPLLLALGVSACAGGEPFELRVVGAESVAPLVARIAEVYESVEPAARVDVETATASIGVNSVGTSTHDIGLVSRPLTTCELEAFPELRARGFARDAIVPIVHPDNPIEEIDLDELAAVYAGRITDWSALGGTGPVVVVSRQAGSGDRTFFEGVVLAGEALRDDVVTVDTARAMLATVESEPGAIGYVSLGELSGAIATLQIDLGSTVVEASADSARAGRWPITRSFLLITLGSPDENELSFVDFVLSPVGQDAVAETGFVPVL